MRTTLVNVLMVLIPLAIGAEKVTAQQQAAPSLLEVQNDDVCVFRRRLDTGSIHVRRRRCLLRPECNGPMRPKAR